MPSDIYRHEQIPSRTTVDARLTLFTDAYTLTIINTCRNNDLDLLFIRNVSGTTAIRTFIPDNLTGTATIRTGLHVLNRTEQWTAGVYTIWPFPLHFGQVSGEVPGFAPVPWQVAHSSFRFISISFSQPKIASSKVMRTLVRTLAPCIGPFRPAAAASAAAEQIAENIAENIAHISATEIEAAKSARSACASVKGRMTKLIILSVASPDHSKLHTPQKPP